MATYLNHPSVTGLARVKGRHKRKEATWGEKAGNS